MVLPRLPLLLNRKLKAASPVDQSVAAHRKEE
jgi:hypothetical protein